MSSDRGSTFPVALFETDDGAIVTRDDFLRALSVAGIRGGDICLVHTSLLTFGRPKTDGATIAAELSRVLQDAVSPAGTLILPTFSYSFCKDQEFNVQETPGTVGALNEFFRKQPGVLRTAHPIFSFAIWGQRQIEMMAVDDDSFGRESLFGKLHALNGKIVSFGAGNKACTFVHYVEQCYGVPYRYMKTFSGTVIDRGVARKRDCQYFVRHLDDDLMPTPVHLDSKLRHKGHAKVSSVGAGQVIAVDAKDLYETAWEMLDADIFSLCERKQSEARG